MPREKILETSFRQEVNMKENSGKKKGGTVLLVLLGILFVLSVVCHSVKLFVSGVARFYPLPYIFGIDGDGLTDYFTSVFPTLISAVLILASAGLAVFVSIRNKADTVKVFAVYCAVAAGIQTVLCFTAKFIIMLFGADAKVFFSEKYAAFCDISMIFALILFIACAVLFSVSASIRAAKKKLAKGDN